MAVAAINPKIKNLNIPPYLQELKGWLVWRYEANRRKVPYYVGGGRRQGTQGADGDRSQLTTFDEAKQHAARGGFDGVGLALMPDYDLIALDFDKCVDASGVIDPKVEALVAGTYAEYSPSRTGVRAFVRGKLKDQKYNKPDKLNAEFFCNKGFVTITGDVIEQTDMLDCADVIKPISTEIKSLYDEYWGEKEDPFARIDTDSSKVGAKLEHAIEALTHLDANCEYHTWVQIGMGLKHEFGDEAFDLWDQWSAGSATQYPGRHVLQQKWQSFRRNNQKPNDRVITFRNVLAAANQAGARIFIPKVATLEDFEELVDTPSEEGEPARFNLTQAADYIHRRSANWIIKGLLPQGELVVIYGEPGSGKSFFGSELGLAISRGGEWRGRKVKRGAVVYVAAEGASGFAKRLKAYAHVHQVDLKTLDFYVIDGTPNLLNKEDAVELTKSIKQTCEPSVIFIDTLAQTTPGANENSAEDMGAAIAHCKAIHKATGALVVLIHHSGKDATKGARGWSGLRGAVETEILVARLQVGRYATVRKQKDGEDGGVYGFDLEVVPVGIDEDGEVITSCVVKEINSPVATSQKKVFGKWEQMIIDEAKAQLKTGVTVTADDVIDAIYDTLEPLPDDKRDQRKATMRRAMTNLSTDSQSPLMVTDGGLEWIGADD